MIRLGEDSTPGMLNFDDLLVDASAAELARLDALGATLQFDDPINIQFTSGTTGQPKGATLTHHNILNNGFFVGVAMQFTETRPPVHSRAAVSLLWHGARQSGLHHTRRGDGLPGRSFNAEAVLETIEAERCTALHGVPTMFIAVLEHPRFRALRPDAACAPASWPALLVPRS